MAAYLHLLVGLPCMVTFAHVFRPELADMLAYKERAKTRAKHLSKNQCAFKLRFRHTSKYSVRIDARMQICHNGAAKACSGSLQTPSSSPSGGFLEMHWVRDEIEATLIIETVLSCTNSKTAMFTALDCKACSRCQAVEGPIHRPLRPRHLAQLEWAVLAERLPVELETAALGGALQAAACHQGFDVAEYIRQNPTKLSEKVSMIAFYSIL
eukprot:1140301-Pelagomonas_calceolata.AAC.1